MAADYMYVNDLNNSEYLTREQTQRFEAAKQAATSQGHEFLSPEWKAAWSAEFGDL